MPNYHMSKCNSKCCNKCKTMKLVQNKRGENEDILTRRTSFCGQTNDWIRQSPSNQTWQWCFWFKKCQLRPRAISMYHYAQNNLLKYLIFLHTYGRYCPPENRTMVLMSQDQGQSASVHTVGTGVLLGMICLWSKLPSRIGFISK